jgi:nucleolar pre-ribosomal-associated protein 1
MRSGAALSSSGMDDETYPSPLIMTIAEQLDAKIKAGLLPPSDILAISSFVRKVVFRLLGQVQNIGFLKAFVVRMDQILGETRLWLNEYPMMTRAVRMEVKMMYAVVRPSQRVEVPLESNSGLEEYLEEIEALPSGASASFCATHS